MADTGWKPKRVGAGASTPDESSNEFVVEVSVTNTECKSILTKFLGEIGGIRIKDSKAAEPADLLILELEENPEETLSVVRDMAKSGNGPEVFLTGPTLDSNVLLEALRSGAKEFFAQPIQQQEVERAIAGFRERASTQVGPSKSEKKPGKLISLFGGKGGVGTTSIAVNLAASLHELPQKPSVIIVDVNQHGGDLPLYLDLAPTHSFRDIAADTSRLDQAFLHRVVTKCESGLGVLPSGYDDLSTGRLNPDCVEVTLKLLQASFDYVVIDCGNVLDLTTKKTLELSTWIMVASTLMVPVVHRTKRILELLRGSGFPAAKIRLIMNRYLAVEEDVLQETEDILKQKAYWFLPNDYPSASQAVNSGKPIGEVAPRSALAKAYHEFAVSFDDQPSTEVKKGAKSGWLGFLKGRRAQPSTSGA